MIKGMTGFGSAELSLSGFQGLVEIRSVNHRYLDTSFYLPSGFAVIEDKLKTLIQKQAERGRVTLSFRIVDKPVQNVVLNKDVVAQHLRYVKQLQKEFKIENDLRLSDLIRLPGVLETKETFLDPKKSWPALENSVQKALTDLMRMRKSEGKSLASDVSGILTKMNQSIRKISARAAAMIRDKRKILNEDEFTSFQKGSNVSEELARLAHYILEIKILLKSDIAVGKKIDFIAQEMQRETNTIGSKIQDKEISNAVIALKHKIEKIREQAQNIE